MDLSEGGWFAAAAVVAFVSMSAVASRRRKLTPSAVFFPATCAWLSVKNFQSLYDLGGERRLLALCLILGAASPVLVWGWRKRKAVLRTGFVLATGALALAGWTLIFPASSVLPALLAVLTAGLTLLPYGKWHRQIRWRRQARRERLQERQLEKAAHAAETASSRSRDSASPEIKSDVATRQTLEQQAQRIAQLEAQAKDDAEDLDTRRQEILDRVRAIRQREVERIQKGETGIVVDEYCGVVMLEAWRVLRAEIASGARIPPIESDVFFEEGVRELLSAKDFEQRYCSEAGKNAAASLNRFLTGLTPLAAVQDEIRHSGLSPDHVASCAVEGDFVTGLLEAWLVPFRRWQRACFVEFMDGVHPRQQQLEDLLGVDADSSLDFEHWKKRWDEQPAAFVLDVGESDDEFEL